MDDKNNHTFSVDHPKNPFTHCLKLIYLQTELGINPFYAFEAHLHFIVKVIFNTKLQVLEAMAYSDSLEVVNSLSLTPFCSFTLVLLK